MEKKLRGLNPESEQAHEYRKYLKRTKVDRKSTNPELAEIAEDAKERTKKVFKRERDGGTGEKSESDSEKDFWEKRKSELIRQGLLNESILTRAQALLGLSEAWMVLQARIEKDDYIPKVLEVAQKRRENAHGWIAGNEKHDLSETLDNAILDILLDQDTAEYLAGFDRIYEDATPAFQNAEITRLNTMRGFLREKTSFQKAMSYDQPDESDVLRQGIKKKWVARDFRPQYGENDITRLALSLTHFRRDFLTILRVLAEHKAELDVVSAYIPDDPLAVDRMAAHLYTYSKASELENKRRYKFDATETPKSALTIMDEGYYLGSDTSEPYQRVGMLIRSQTEAAIRKVIQEMKGQESRELLTLIQEQKKLLESLFDLEGKIAHSGKKSVVKKPLFSWGKKEQVSSTESVQDAEEQNKLRILREAIITELQSEKFKPVREDPKSHVPSETELVQMAIVASLGKQ